MRKQKSIFLFLLLSLICFESVRATDFYVSKTGNDTSGDGTEANPWFSVGKAFQTVKPNENHLIRIGAGTFTETVRVTAPSGTTIVGAGTDKTVISSPSATVFQLDKSKNVTLRDFAIDGQNKSIQILSIEGCTNINVLNVDLRNGEGAGFNAGACKNIVVDGGVYTEAGGRGDVKGDKSVVEWGNITNGIFTNVTINDVKAQSWRAGQDMRSVVVTRCIFNGCKAAAWNDGASGNISIEWWGVTNVTNCEISYCVMNGTISLASTAASNKSMRVHHNEVFGNYGVEMIMSNLEIDHNFFRNTGYAFASFGENDRMENQLIHHNVLYKMGGPTAILHYSGYLKNAQVYNNTVYVEGSTGYNYLGKPAENVAFVNNIFVNKKALAFNNYGQKTDYNLFQYSKPVGEHALGADPLFVSTASGLAGMTLKSGSPGIDAGVVIPGITDNATDGKPDLGAFEFGETWTVGPNGTGALQARSVVTITAPVEGRTFVVPADITLTAIGASQSGIARIEFYQNDIKMGEVFSEPYNYVWSNVSKGNYKIHAIIVDKQGLSEKSKPLTIYASDITTTITSPLMSEQFTSSSDITINAEATVKSGAITKVEFFSGTEKIGESTAAPYSLVWKNVPSGQYVLKTIATDDSGISMKSPVVVITVIKGTTVVNDLSVNTIKIYPNPSSGIINLEMTDSNLATFTVINAAGQLIKSGKFSGSIETIDLSEKKGVFIIRVDNGKTSCFEKVVVQ